MVPERGALLTIDVQGDFYAEGAPALVEGTRECIPAMARVAAAFRAAGMPIIHVVRLYSADGSNAEPVRRRAVTAESIVRPGTAGSQVAPELLPSGAPPLDPDLLMGGGLQRVDRDEWYMYKPRWGAFYGTPLEESLRELDVRRVVLVGCNFPNCPRTTVYEASERDLETTLVPDAVSGVYDRGLTEVADIGTVVPASDEFVADH